MSSAIYCRLMGQAVAISMHSINSISMLIAMQNEELMKDPQIKTMTSLQSQYFTVWNVGFQLMYFFLGFICDILTVSGRDHMIPKSISNIRQTFFAAVLWPGTMLVFTLFWPIFLTNREILYPAFIDKIFPLRNNLVIHFWILPVLLWEAVFLPRRAPKSHRINLIIVSLIFIAYIISVLHTYSRRGVWPYPVTSSLYGTIYLPIILFIIYLLCTSLYFLQFKMFSLAKTQKIVNKKNK